MEIKVKDELEDGDKIVARGIVYEARHFVGDCRTSCDCWKGTHCTGLCWRYFNGAGRLNFRKVCEDVELTEGTVVCCTSWANSIALMVDYIQEVNARSRRELYNMKHPRKAEKSE